MGPTRAWSGSGGWTLTKGFGLQPLIAGSCPFDDLASMPVVGERETKHMSDINMQGEPAKVLAALYNASKPQGRGFMSFDAKQMTEAEAATILESQTYFDYLKGRVMKVDLSGDSFAPFLYDRDNGNGAAARALADIL